jgi:ribosomal protein S27AE
MDKLLTETEKLLQSLKYECPKCGHPIQRGNRSEIQCGQCGLTITVSSKYNRLIGWFAVVALYGTLIGLAIGLLL